MSVSVAGLTMTYRGTGTAALDSVTLDVEQGELLVVVGPSGSGKSTLLRCIAGLEEPDAGTVYVGGADVTRLDPGRRDVAMVFQDHALYPHLDVATNIAFPLMARRMSKEEIGERVTRAVEIVGLHDVLRRRPAELSGGERRRVSLARAVVREPKAFLMDEPLANLDAALKLRVQDEIRSLQARLGVTTIYVTHDQTEAMTLGRRIAVLRDGRVEQVGTPLDLFDRPANLFVATFLGRNPMNVLPGPAIGDAAPTVGIRPEALVVADAGRMRGTVRAIDHLGSEVLAEVDVAGDTIFARVPRDHAPAAGDAIGLDFSDSDVHRFDGSGDRIA